VTVLIHMAPKTVNRAKDDGTSTIHKRVWLISVGCMSLLLLFNDHVWCFDWLIFTADSLAFLPQLRSGVRYTCIAVQLLLLTKASVMAVSSPDDLWPVTVQQPIRVDHFVGLFYMYVRPTDVCPNREHRAAV